MARINLVDPSRAEGKAKALLDSVKKKLGVIPNLTRGLANSSAALDAYFQLNGALASSSLSAKVREALALTVAEINECGYCLSAHSFIGGELGLSPAEIDDAREAVAGDPKTSAVLALAKEIVLRRGDVKDADLRTARAAGVTDAEIAEVVAIVALNVFTNYFNRVAATPIDFPEVKAGMPSSKPAAFHR